MLLLPLSPSSIAEAVKVLKRGGVVVYPTDTLYGMGADATNDTAVKRVYAIKGRDFKKPLSVAVLNRVMTERFTKMEKEEKFFFDAFFPGPFTLIFSKRSSNLSPRVTRGTRGIGVRVPHHPVVAALVSGLKRPITCTSANVAGKPTPCSARQIYKMFHGREIEPDLILDAGVLRNSKPSVIIDIRGRKPMIHRASPRVVKIFEKKLYELKTIGS